MKCLLFLKTTGAFYAHFIYELMKQSNVMICIGFFIDMVFLCAQFPRKVRVSSDTFNYIDNINSAPMVFLSDSTVASPPQPIHSKERNRIERTPNFSSLKNYYRIARIRLYVNVM